MIGLSLIISLLSKRLSIPLALDIGIGVTLLAWFYVVIAYPWNLYFSARTARFNAEESKRRDINVDTDDYQTLRSLERTLLFVALLAHLLSSVVIHFASIWSEGAVRPQFAYLFGVTALLRPSFEFYMYLRIRLAELSERVKRPRDDVRTLKEDLLKTKDNLESYYQNLDEFANSFKNSYNSLLEIVASEKELEAKYYDSESEKINQLSKSFDHVVHQLSSGDRDLVVGIRALARLFKHGS